MKKLLLFIICLSGHSAIAQDAKLTYNKMMLAIEQVKTATFVLDIQERVFGKTMYDQYVVKLQPKPYKCYVFSVKPNPGAEALFVAGTNNGKVLINPNRFPYINLSLSIHSMLLRKNHQYQISQMGFGYIHDLLNKYMIKDKEKFFQRLSIQPDVEFNNKSYNLLVIDNPDFGFEKYTVKKGETVFSIAEKLLVNDHMIRELNTDIDDYYDVKEGQVILVPNSFAKKILFYLDKKTNLPLIQITYDDQGLYGRVEMSSFVLNPFLDPLEFTRSYSKYHF